MTEDLERLLKENIELARENNRILRKLHRNSIIDFWFRIVWYAFLIGLPFALYFYVVEPYLELFGSSSDQVRIGLQELPGLKALNAMFGGGQQ